MRPIEPLEAPTYLGSHQLPLPPEWLPDDEHEVEPATHAARRGATERSVNRHQPAPDVTPRAHGNARRREPTHTPAAPIPRDSVAALPAPPQPERVRPERARSERPSASASSSSSSSKSKSRSKSRSAAGSGAQPMPQPPPAPQPAAAAAPPPAAAPQLPPNINAVDPLQIPVPPELAGPIYGWVRRLALQADLKGADRVLRDALADMTSSLTVAIVYPGEDGLWTLGNDDEIPRDAQPIIAVGRARRAVIGSHTALVPIVTSSEVVAVVVLTRNPRNPGYHPLEQIAAIALARESAAILHHLAVQHLQNAAEIKADQGGLYRGEALEAHRTRGQEGQVVHLSPGWVRRTYPLLVITLIVGIVAAVLMTVPTYSSGLGVVVFDGTPIAAPIGGTVDQLLVSSRQEVKQGQILARLNNAAEAAELTAAISDYDNATMQYLYDPQDEQTKKTLASALTRVERARAQAETRVIRARTGGVVGDLRIKPGSMINAGDVLLTIVQPQAWPEITAFLPGKDRPRLRVGMELQVDLTGYTKGRERALITSISTDVVAGEEIAHRILGPGLAGSFRELNGHSWVIVKARLPKRTFEADKRTNYYHHGLTAKTEVKIQSKPFLVTLLPALDKYVP